MKTKKNKGGGQSPPEKNQNRNHFVFLSFWVNPLSWQSFIEISEIACSRTARCSRGHTLKIMVWVAPQIIQAQGLIIHVIMRKSNSTIVQLHVFQTTCKRWYFSLSLQKFQKTTWERGLETRQTLNSTWSSLPTSFKSEGNTLTDPMELADRFCKYFINIGPNLARSIPSVNPSFRCNLCDNNHPSSDLKPTQLVSWKAFVVYSL